MTAYSKALGDITALSPGTTQANEFLARIASRVDGIYYSSFIHDLGISTYIFARLETVIGAHLLDVNPQFNSGSGVAYEPVEGTGGAIGLMAISTGYFAGSSWERFFTILDHEAGHAETTVYFQNQSMSHQNSINASIINDFISNPTHLDNFVNTGINYETINEAYTIARSWNDWLSNYKLNHSGNYYYGGDYNSSSYLFQEALKHFDGLTMITSGSMNFIAEMSVGSDGMIQMPANYADAGGDATLKAIADRVKVKSASVSRQPYGVDQGAPIISHILEMKEYLSVPGVLKFNFSSYGFVDKGGAELSSSEIVGQLFRTKALYVDVGTQVFVNSSTNDTFVVKQSISGDVVTTSVYIFSAGTTVPSPESIPSTLSPSQQVIYNKSTESVLSVSGVSLPSPDTIEGIIHPKTELSAKGSLYGNVGFALGSALGNILANGNQVEGIVYSTLLGQIGKGLAIAADGIQSDWSSFIHGTNTNVLDNFGGGLGAGLLSSSVGTISSTLTIDLANQLGVKGFGAELISTVVSADTSAVVVQVLNNIHNSISAFGAGFTTDAFQDSAGNVILVAKNASLAERAAVAGDKALPTTNFQNVALNAIASYFGSKLASIVVQPQTQAAAVLSSLGSTIGATIGGILGGPLGAFVGSFLGQIEGTFIGNGNVLGSFLLGGPIAALAALLFGHKKPKIPTASAETVLALPFAQYKLSNVTSTNGGSTNVVVEMAEVAAETLNSLIAQVTGGGVTPHFVSNVASPTLTFGYNGTSGYYYKLGIGGASTPLASSDQAVDAAVVWAIPQTQIIGGDIFTKRVIKNSSATDIMSLLGDVQTAKDYGNYATNRDVINSYITSAYAKLTQAEQDYYTANKTLVDKVDMSGVSSLTSGELATYNANTQTINNIVAAVQSQSVANPWIITLERANELGLNSWAKSDFYGGVAGFLQSFGMGVVGSTVHYEDVKLGWSGGSLTLTDSATSGQGLFSVLAQANANGSAVTIANFASVMGYATATMGAFTSSNTIESVAGATTAVTFNNAGHVGYNIFIGGNGGNTITAGTDDTWIQGGSGTDILHGGAGHDVIIAGSGNTTILGGNAASYLAAGSGTDSITGGNGNDTIILGNGNDTINGGAGDDFIVLSGLAAGSASIDGGSGNNTLSFERYAAGVNVNLGAWVSPSGTSYMLTNIQNLIGSVAGGNVLKTTAGNATMEGGAGNDTFIGVSGGSSTVTFSNSGSGVYVDLSTGVSFGGSSTGDVFTNIKNITGSGFDDELKGIAGSTLDGGTGGNDWFDYSGGGNTFRGSVNGNNTLDYSLAPGYASNPGYVIVNLTNQATTGGTAYAGGANYDTLYNINHIIGSNHGTKVTGAVSTTVTYNSDGTKNTSGAYTPLEFTATGGVNTLSLGGNDTVDLGVGGGTVNVTGLAINAMTNETLRLGNGMTYDNLWGSMSATVQGNIYGVGSAPPQWQSTTKWSFGIRGTSDVASYTVNRAGYDQSIPTIQSTLSYISMNGASTLDLSGIHSILGELSYSGGSYYDTNGMWTEYYTGDAVPAATTTGSQTGGMLILTGGAAGVINVDGGAVTSNGSVIIAGQAGSAGITIITSAGDDQITFERGDGHYTINGTGGQKTIDFGPSVAASDVIYRVIGDDLYIGVQDLTNPDLTADQVSDRIKLVGGAIHTTNADGTLTFTHPFFIQVGGTTIDLSKLTTVDWTGGDVVVAEISTPNGSVSVSNMTVNVNSGLTGSVTGSGDTINAGTGSHITIAGNANVINTTSGAVTLSGINSALSVNGNSNTITMSGTGDVLTVNGSGNSVTGTSDTIYANTAGATLTVNGSGNNVYVRAKDMAITSGASTIVFDTANDGGTVIGTGSTIVAGATGQSLSVSGSGNTVYMRGNGDTLTASNATVVFDTSGVTETINGDGNTFNITGYGDVINVNGTNDTVAGHWATINLTKTGTANTVSGVGLTVNAVNGDTVTMACNPTSGDQVSTLHLSSGTVHLQTNSHIDLYGASNAITVAGGDNFGVWGDNNTVVGTGINSISSSGNNLKLTMSNSQLTDSGNGVSTTLVGANNLLYANGSTEHFSITGTGNTVQGSGAIISLAGSDNSINVNGASNAVTAAGAATINIQGSASVTASNSTIGLSDWPGTGGNVDLTGNGDTINLNGYWDTIAVHGTNETINGHWATVNLTQANAAIAVSGIGLTVNAASGDAISISSVITSGDQTDTVNLLNGTVNILSGSTVRVTGNNDTVTVQSGAYAYITSTNTGTTVVSNGGGIDIEGTVTANVSNSTINSSNSSLTFSVDGAGNTLNLNGSGDVVAIHGDNNTINNGGTLNLTGTGDVVNDSGGTVNLNQANSTLTVNGSNDTITVGANDTLTVTGDADTVTAGVGSVIHGTTLSGPQGGQITVTATNSTLTMANNGRLSIYGDGNTASLGTNTNLYLHGNSETITQGSGTATLWGTNEAVTIGSGSTLWVYGDHAQVNTSGSTLTSSVSSGTTGLTGDNNTFTVQSGNNIVNLAGGGNTVNMGWGTLTLSSTNKALTVNGIGMTVNAASGDNVTMSGMVTSGDQISDLYLSNGAATIMSGNDVRVHGSNNAVTIQAGAYAHITSEDTSTTVTSNGGSMEVASAVTANVSNATINNWTYGVAVTVNGTGNTLNLNGWGEVVSLQGGNNTIFSNQTTVNAGNGSVINLTTMNGPSGARTDVNVTNGTINLAANSHSDIFGNGNAVHLAGGDYSGIWGDNETVTATGNNSLWANGNNLTFHMSGSTFIYSGSNVSATVNGDNNTITGNGAGEHVTLNGANNTAYANEAGEQFTINGANNLVQGDNATVTLSGTGSSALVHGVNNTVTAGNGSNLDIDGTATVTASGSTISTAGWGNTSGNIVITGDNDVINLDGYGDTVSIDGTNETISGHWTTVNLTLANAILTIDGIGLTVNAADGDAVTISSNITSGDQLTNLNLSNGTVDVTSGEVRINGNNDIVTIEAGGSAYITSTDTGITVISDGGSVELESQVSGTLTNTQIGSYLDNASFTVNGDGNTASLHGWYDTVTVQGDNNAISGNHATISLTGNETLTVTGDDNTINAGINSVVTIETLSGPLDHSDYVNISSGTVNSQANTSFWVTGDSNIVNIGAGSCLALTGNLNTITSVTAVIAYIIGSNYSTTANVINSSIYLQSSSETVTVTGDGNTITANSNNDIINVSGNGSTINANWGTVNLTGSGAYTVEGIGLTVNAASGDTVTIDCALTSWDQVDTLNLSNGTAIISGEILINGNNDVISVQTGAPVTGAVVTGDDNTVTLASNAWLNIYGSGNAVTGGTGDTINLAGGDNAIVGNQATITLTGSGAITVTGDENIINAADGDTITVHGTDDVINVSNSTIYKGNTSTVTINGTGNTVVTLGVAPIILDLGDDGLELTPVGSSDIVTTASNGALTRLGWVGPTNGILVTDRNGDGQYGDVQDISFTQDRIGARTDLEGLAGWDSNGDGVISATDTGWSKLRVWVDANGDGVSEDGEVKSLDELGVSSISLKRDLTGNDGTLTTDSYASATSSFTRTDGTTGMSYDVTLGQQVLAASGWQESLGTTWTQLTNYGQIGNLSDAAAAQLGTADASDINYDGLSGLDAVTEAIWGDFLDPVKNAARKAALASGQVGDTSWMQQNGVTVADPNRGAHVTTQRLQVLDLDLSGLGPSVTELADSPVKVDVNLTGNPYSVAWVGASDGLLVIDALGDGDIDVATEATFQSWVPYARTSLQGLTAFDTSGDGAIDADDKVFGALRIWTDSNGDGISQASEMTTLSNLGVKSISLTAEDENADTKTLDQSQILASATVTMTDGSSHLLYDVALGVGDPNAKPNTTTTNTTATADNPTLQELAQATDVTVAPVTATDLDQSLTSPLDAATDQVSAARSSQGPAGEVMTADGDTGSAAAGWWHSDGYSLSDSINQFNAVGPDSEGQGATPVATANDAAMIQRHLLLRQAIAGFTVQGAAPAVFARQGGLDTLSTLAAATQSTTTPTSGMTSKAA